MSKLIAIFALTSSTFILHSSFFKLYSLSFIPMLSIRDTGAGATFVIRVRPRAKKNAVLGEFGDALKVALTAPPVEGRANQACIEFLAEILDVPRSSITIAAGQSSRNKIIRVVGLRAAEVEQRLRAAVP